MRHGRISTSPSTFSALRSWAAVSELAARQHGVASLAQLTAVGASTSTVRGWVGRGLVIRLHQAVYAVGHANLRPEGRLMAAVLACGAGAVASHRSAAAHLGLRRGQARLFDVTAPAGRGRGRSGIRVHRGPLSTDEVAVVDEVPCTTVSRTLLDLSAVLDQRGIERAIEGAERAGLFDLHSLTVLLARHRGRRGTARLRRALTEFDADILHVRSELEARFLRLCADRGLAKPIVNGRIETVAAVFEVDFHWPWARTVVETDGDEFHRTTAARRRDAYRDRALMEAGWIVIRCGWPEVVRESDALIASLRQQLRHGRISTSPSTF